MYNLEVMNFEEEVIEGEVRTELDFLVICVQHMRRIRQEKGLRYSHAFQVKMEEYFDLNNVDWTTFIYDDLLRLASKKAGIKDDIDS